MANEAETPEADNARNHDGNNRRYGAGYGSMVKGTRSLTTPSCTASSR